MELRATFNEDETNYDRARPGYPPELFADVIGYAGLNASCRALEIGIGTGQATPPILQTGCSVTAIELGDRLSRYTAAKFADSANLRVVNADFMDCVLAPESFELVYCATAFHWLPMEAGYGKVREVLVPGGSVALFWNHPFPNRADDPTNVINARVYGKYRPTSKAQIEFGERDCVRHRDELARFGFRDIDVKLYHRVRRLSSDEYIALINTYSDHRALPKDTKSAFEYEMKRSLDEIGGYINIYDTIDLYLARK